MTRDSYSYSYKLLVTFSISIRTTHLWSSSYSDYQQYLFDRIRGFKEHFLTPIGYRKISQIFNKDWLKHLVAMCLKTNTFIPFIRKVYFVNNQSMEGIS